MRGTLLAAVVLATVVLPLALPATEYYVAAEASGASDSNTGLSRELGGTDGPWRTIRKAAATARAGDVVYVHSGDYTSEGSVFLDNSGQAGSPIKFSAALGETPVVAGFNVRSKSWIVIEGFTIRNQDFNIPTAWREMPTVVVDDPSIVIDLDEDWSTREAKVRAKYATVMGMIDEWESNWSTGIDVKSSSDIVIRGNDIAYFALGIQLRNQSARITVQDNQVHHCRSGIFTWRSTPSVTDSAITGNAVYQNLAEAIDIREDASGVRVEDNLVEYNATSHILVHTGASQTLVKNNVARYGGYYSETMRHPGSSSINFHTAGAGNIADGNVAAYQVDETQLDGNGFIVDLMYGTPVTLRNNIAYRNMGSGIMTTRSGSCTFVNNSLIENGYLSDHPHNGAGVRFAKAEDSGHVIVNNIFSKNRVAGIWTNGRLDSAATVDSNLYFQPDSALIWDGSSTSDRYYADLETLRAETGREFSGVWADPALVSNGELEYRLHSTSPARSAALASYAPIDDFEGDIRDSSPDIGHDEYSSVDSAPPTVVFVQPNGEGTSVEIEYSEPVGPDSAAVAGNYQIDGSVEVLSASMEGAGIVRLQTTRLTKGRRYELTVSGVRDSSGNPIEAGSQYEFDFVEATELAFQRLAAPDESFADARLSEAQPTTNFGTNSTIEILGDDPGGDSVGLFKWDVSTAPPDAGIVSAEIEVEVSDGESGRVEAYGLLRDWRESTANWLQPDSSQVWDSAGAAGAGDREPVPSGTASINGAGLAKVRLNENGLALLQSWLDGGAANHGFVFALRDGNSAVQLVSGEAEDILQRPRLLLRYVSRTVSGPPAAPTGVQVTAVSTTSVSLAWDSAPPDEAVASYRVYRSGQLVGPASTASFIVEGLAPDSSYTFQVKAVDGDGRESGPSNSVSARTLSTTPSTLTITSPANATSVAEGTRLTFAGTATDGNGEDMSGRIFWSSSVDGGLGTGGNVPAVLSLGAHSIRASFVDNAGQRTSRWIDVTVTSGSGGNTAPTVTITSPANGTSVEEGTSLSFRGSASDAEDGDISNRINWSSSRDGALGAGAAIGKTLTVGVHTITAQATDDGGLTANSSINLTVTAKPGGNGTPTLTITSPANGTSVAEGTRLTFAGAATDGNGEDMSGRIFWSSSVDGGLGTGGSVPAVLSLGAHSIRASFVDNAGQRTSRWIDVTVASGSGGNTAPTVTITSPANGTSVEGGTSLSFRGSASDAEDGDISNRITWSSSRDGVLGAGAAIGKTLTVGLHTITAQATDDGGLTANSSISVTVTQTPGGNGTPTLTITSPANGTSVAGGTRLTFSGTATDGNGGDMSGRIFWSSNVDGGLGTGVSVSALLSVGSHSVRASFVDNAGRRTSRWINVTVTP